MNRVSQKQKTRTKGHHLIKYEPCVTLPKKPVFFSSSTRFSPGFVSLHPSTSSRLLVYVGGRRPKPSGPHMEYSEKSHTRTRASDSP